MGLDTGLVIFIVLFIFLFCFIPYCCRRRARQLRQAEVEHMNALREMIRNGQRVVRVATVSRTGQVSVNVYEIRVDPRNRGGVSAMPSYEETPPPPFQTALEVSTPVVRNEEEEIPPPSYEDFMKVHSAHNLDNINEESNENSVGNNSVIIDSNSNSIQNQRY